MKVINDPGHADTTIRRAHNAAQDRRNAASAQHAGIPHISDLIFCRTKTMLQQKLGLVDSDMHSADTLVMFLAGQGHHAFLEAGRTEEPLFITWAESGGKPITVVGTPDYVEEDGTPHEFKTTRTTSSRPDISAHYLEQLASYALMLGVTSGWLSIVYLNGDYNKAGGYGMRPQLVTRRIEFTEQELAAWEKELHRRARLLESYKQQPSDKKMFMSVEHRDWECAYCPFAPGGVVGGCEVGGKGAPHDARVWFGVDQDD